jgi:hypothetical protein
MKRIVQFGFKPHGNPYVEGGGVPVVNCTVIPNPWRRGDKATDEQRIAKVRLDPQFEELVEKGVRLLRDYDKIGVACLHGKHRSGAVAAEIAERTGAVVEKLS